MAGPAASVLLRSAPVESSRLVDELTRLATHVEGNDFWFGDEHPFLFEFDGDEQHVLEGMDDDGFQAIFGWRPQAALTFLAMCNRERDHELLAELCIHFAEQLGGIIDFGGQLHLDPGLNSASRSVPGRIEGLPGLLHAEFYKTANGELAICHYGDAAFLREFMRGPRFRMVK